MYNLLLVSVNIVWINSYKRAAFHWRCIEQINHWEMLISYLKTWTEITKVINVYFFKLPAKGNTSLTPSSPSLSDYLWNTFPKCCQCGNIRPNSFQHKIGRFFSLFEGNTIFFNRYLIPSYLNSKHKIYKGCRVEFQSTVNLCVKTLVQRQFGVLKIPLLCEYLHLVPK